MSMDRTRRVRSMLLAAISLIAALSLIAFGSAANSSSGAAVRAPHAPAAAAKALAHTDVQVVTRTALAVGAEHQSPLPAVGLAASAVVIAFAGWLLIRAPRRPRRSAWYFPGPAPARAPPLAA